MSLESQIHAEVQNLKAEITALHLKLDQILGWAPKEEAPAHTPEAAPVAAEV
jgi:hypothetical protein